MSTTVRDRLVGDYISELRDRTRRLSREQRETLLSEVKVHLDEAAPAEASEATVRLALEHLGTPDFLAAEAMERLDVSHQAGKRECIAVFGLAAGGLVLPILGWLAAVTVLWSSKVWSRHEKIIGTLLPPGGLSVVIYLTARISTECTSTGGLGRPTVKHCSEVVPLGLTDPVFAAFILAGLLTPIWLGRRAFVTHE